MEAKNQGGLALAKTMLQEGADIEAIIAETSLSRPTILGLKGSLIKAQKRLAATEDRAAKASPSENLEEEQINTDLKKETQTTNQAIALARGQQRLKVLNPKSEFLHEGQQPESSTSRLADLEIARYVKSMRLEEETARHNNGDSQASGFQKQINDLREQLHQKDVQNLRDETTELKQELKEIRSEMRNSVGSTSDLAIVVKESKDLLSQVISHDGPLRAYLMPSDIPIGKKADAPALLHAQIETGSGTVISELARHGLVTQMRKGP